MFEKDELAMLHKALSELLIKGSDSPRVATLLNKIATLHTPPGETAQTVKTKPRK